MTSCRGYRPWTCHVRTLSAHSNEQLQAPQTTGSAAGQAGYQAVHPLGPPPQAQQQHPTVCPATLNRIAQEQLLQSTGTNSTRQLLLHGDSKVSCLAPGRTVPCTAVHDRKSWSQKVLFPARSRQSSRSASLRHLSCSTRGVCTPALCLRRSTQLSSTITVIVQLPTGVQLGRKTRKSSLFL